MMELETIIFNLYKHQKLGFMTKFDFFEYLMRRVLKLLEERDIELISAYTDLFKRFEEEAIEKRDAGFFYGLGLLLMIKHQIGIVFDRGREGFLESFKKTLSNLELDEYSGDLERFI